MVDDVLKRLSNSKEKVIPLTLRIEESSKVKLENIAYDLDVTVTFLLRSVLNSFIDEYESKDLKC
jgi:hypothetical protein